MSYRSVTDQYELATHTVKVRRSGMLSDVSVLWDMSNSSMVTGSAQSELVTNKLKIERLPSINCFNKVCGRTFMGKDTLGLVILVCKLANDNEIVISPAK